EVSGELPGCVEASEVANFGEHGDGDGVLDAAQGLKSHDRGVKAPARNLLGEHGGDATQALDVLGDGTERFLKDDLLGGSRADHLGQVAQVGLVPVSLASVANALAKEKGLEAQLRGLEVLEGVLPSASQVAHGLILDRGNMDGGEIA